jgi:hypothetical protein
VRFGSEGEGKGGDAGLSSRASVTRKARGGCGFSSLMKQKKRGKITLSFTSPEKENYFLYIYDVI